MRPQPRVALAIASAAPTNGEAVTATAIDTSPASGPRARHMTLDIIATVANVVSNKPSVLKLTHSDITDATGYSDISGTIGGTDFTIPSADTSVANIYKFNVNLQGKKRYIKAAFTPRTTQTVFGVANLFWADQAPVTIAKANVLALVEV